MKNGKKNEWKNVKAIKNKKGEVVKEGFNEKWYGYPEMKEVVPDGKLSKATFEDFQRIFKCLDKPKCKGIDFPTTCSKQPCNTCPNGKLFLGLDFSNGILNKYHIT